MGLAAHAHTEMPVVVLEHVEPDGSVHWDLLLAPDPRGDLIGLRCPMRPDHMPPGSRQDVELLASHRRAWLYEEGPLSRDRGSALRVNAGRVHIKAPGRLDALWTAGGSTSWSIQDAGALCCIDAQSSDVRER